MTTTQLQQLHRVLLTADIVCISEADVADLLITLECEERAQQLRDFKQHLVAALPSMDASEEEQEKFYESRWTISFAGKTVCLENCAQVYDLMQELIDSYIRECL